MSSKAILRCESDKLTLIDRDARPLTAQPKVLYES